MTYTNDDTTESAPTAAAPTKPTRKPMDPETKAFLIGVLGVVGIIGLLLGFWVRTGYDSDDDRAREKTQQVKACSGIEDGLSAYACVVEMNRDRD